MQLLLQIERIPAMILIFARLDRHVSHPRFQSQSGEASTVETLFACVIEIRNFERL